MGTPVRQVEEERSIPVGLDTFTRSVAFVVDGIYMGRSGLGMSDLTDIERVEVLQGPQGTLYGKNANAGVVSVVTKKPNFEEVEGYGK